MKDKAIEIYQKDRALENALRHVKENKKLSDNNKKTILAFSDYELQQDLSKLRVVKHTQQLAKLAQTMNKDIKTAGKKDIEGFISWLNKSDYSENTKRDYKIILKLFYCWLEAVKLDITTKELKLQRKEPTLITSISTTMKNNKKKLPEGLLTEDDILLMLSNAITPRDKAFISCLYESGGRISEIGCMKIKNVSFDDYGSVVSISGKTGSRRCRLVSSSKPLLAWVNAHPQKDNPESALWLGSQSKAAVKYSGLAKILRQVAKRAGIKKAVNPHSFRHARATFLAQYLTESQLKSYLGWTEGSNMAAVYVHLSGKQIDDAILGVYGLKEKPQEEKGKMLPRKCLSCGELNEAQASYCVKCRAALSLEIALNADNEKEKKQAEVLEQLVKALVAKELKGKKT